MEIDELKKIADVRNPEVNQFKHTIRNRFTRNIIIVVEAPSLKEAVEKAVLTGADLSGVDLSGVDLSGVDLSGVDLSGADLSGVDLAGANLARANLARAYLYGADLAGANLARANLARANLYRANFKDTIYENKSFQSFQYQKHYAQMQGDEIIIGCERHSIEYWKKNYKKIGLSNNYSDEQIDAYGKWIMSL